MYAKLVGHEGLVKDVATHPNNANIVVTVGDDGKVKVFDLSSSRTGCCKTTFVLESKPNSRARRSVIMRGDGTIAAASRTVIKIWDLETCSLKYSISGVQDGITAITFHPTDSDVVLVAMENGYLQSFRKQICEASVRAHRHSISDLAFLSTGSHFLTVSEDMHMKLFDMNSLQHVRSFAHKSVVTSVRVSPVDDNLAATASGDKTVRLWQLYGAHPRDECWVLEGHIAWVSCLEFSSNGTVLVSGSFDHSFRIWSTCSGNCLFTYKDAHEGFLLSLGMSFDGTIIVTSSQDLSVRVWDVSAASGMLPETAINELMSCEHFLSPIVRGKNKTTSTKYIENQSESSRTVLSKVSTFKLSSLVSWFSSLKTNKNISSFKCTFPDPLRTWNSITKRMMGRNRKVSPTSTTFNNNDDDGDDKNEKDSKHKKKKLVKTSSSFVKSALSKAISTVSNNIFTKLPTLGVGAIVEADFMGASYEPARIMHYDKDTNRYAVKFLKGTLKKNMRRDQIRDLDLTVPGNLEILNMATRKKRKKKRTILQGPEEDSEEYESEDEEVKDFLAVLRRPKPPPRNPMFESQQNRTRQPVKRSFMFSLSKNHGSNNNPP
jgi:hypothetical protein